jgi:hypothetical protein
MDEVGLAKGARILAGRPAFLAPQHWPGVLCRCAANSGKVDTSAD